MTMTVDEIIKMSINIGGEHIILNVPFNGQNNVRDAEEWANNLFSDLRIKFPSKSASNILARVAFNLAEQLVIAQHTMNQALVLAEECENSLPEINKS